MPGNQVPSRFELCVKVIPKASRTEIVGWENNELKIRLKAVPEKGEANATLIQFLAKTLAIAKSQITLVSGKTTRHKRLILQNITKESLEQIIQDSSKKTPKKGDF